MAGTDHRIAQVAEDNTGPVVVLVAPQLGENIGFAARAMLNFGLSRLRLVAPRDGWPNERAIAAASGADQVIERAEIFEDTAAAIADLDFVLALSARGRDMVKDVFTPRAAAAEQKKIEQSGARCGWLFGPERTGLSNDDISRASALVTVACNPGYASLNLAQAVLLMGYEYYQAEAAPEPYFHKTNDGRLASMQEFDLMIQHLETELEKGGFLRPPEKAPDMMRNIRNLFHKARLTDQEVRSLRGIIKCLVHFRKP